jgi:hypothetical protein
VKPAERPAKSASLPKTGLFAMLRGLLRAEGSGAPSSGAAGGPALTIARRPTFVLLACVCALIGALALGAGSAAAATEFGEEGEHLGQFQNLIGGVAVDNNGLSSSHGDVYVADVNNNRIDKFSSLGMPLLDWGWHVNEEAPAEELQTCTALCQPGTEGPGAGQFHNIGGVAVDPASSDVYVVDRENYRVEQFDPEGHFILTFGWEVNKNGTNVCTAVEAKKCKAGVEGPEGTHENGQFRWSFEGSFIAVGPGGKVYVGDRARVQVFDSSGAWQENISLAELSSEEAVNALAVDASGDVFVVDGFAGGGVHEFTFSKTTLKWEETRRFDENSFGIKAIAVDAGGDLYVEDNSSGGYQFLKYDPTGKQLASFGANTVGFSKGIAFADATGQLYVTGSTIETEGHPSEPRVFVLTPPPTGPVIESEAGKPGLHGEATLEAAINPQGHTTKYHFEYLTEKQFKEDGESFGAGTVATPTPPAALGGSEFEEEHVKAELPEAALVPGETYRWRAVASNECETGKTCTADGAAQTLAETPSALVDGPSAANVTATSATLAARIDPQGASTSYRLEYGPTTAYGHVLGGNVGAGTEFVPVSHYVQELAPATTYHYRFVTENNCFPGKLAVVCTQEGADHAFTTGPAGSQFALPDNRAWELVTPPNTAIPLTLVKRQAASDGSAIAFSTAGAPLGEEGVSGTDAGPDPALSRRGASSWGAQNIHWPISLPKEGANTLKGTENLGSTLAFSSDLASMLFFGQENDGVLVPEALEGTPYLRANLTCAVSEPASCYKPLLTPANTLPGTDLMVDELTGNNVPAEFPRSQVDVLASTPDFTHVVFGSPLKLTAEAEAYCASCGVGGTSGGIAYKLGNLYEWSGGHMQVVSVLPNGSVDKTNEAMPAGGSNGIGAVQRVISGDGRRFAWTLGNPFSPGATTGFRALYVRDTVEGKTAHVGGASARYQTMNENGSRVLFLEHGDLYVYEIEAGAAVDAGTTRDLTASHGPGESSAGVQQNVYDVSEDGSYVYFVATGVLPGGANATGEHASAGADNLYVLHDEGGTWGAPSFIATLSSEDENSWGPQAGGGGPEIKRLSSRVSPNGRYLAFMSNRSLTGYDNVDANPAANGARDEEVFLYHAPEHLAGESGSLICPSCDPSGARPHGQLIPFGGGESTLVEENASWPLRWLAGSVPGWEVTSGDNVHQPRYLSNGGRLFFNSPVALVPQDANGLQDVYEYEPAGEGSCAKANGCVSLISSGHSASESVFMDASEKGNDVFFLSADHLSTADADSAYDIWDAHVCSASSPCLIPPVLPPPCSSGDSCKPAPSPQPELFGAGPSETFSGAGNVVPASKPAVKPKVLTRAQKLSKALASCRKQYQRSKKRRRACERTAHKRYGHVAKRARKANTTKRGGK